MTKKTENGLMFKAYSLRPNPLPDFQHRPLKEPLVIEIDNETLREISEYIAELRG